MKTLADYIRCAVCKYYKMYSRLTLSYPCSLSSSWRIKLLNFLYIEHIYEYSMRVK